MAKSAPKPTPDRATLYVLPMGLIDEPEAPIRASIDPGALDDLASSLRAVGVLQPILVEQRGTRYRIEAGHRRYLAARLAGLTEIPAVVVAAGGATRQAITLHENIYREDLNPAEEALWLERLCSIECGGDTDRLSLLVRQSRQYVEDRLLLLTGDPEVFAALGRGEISLAVARELNRYLDQALRRMRLEAAASGGATARLVREWRTKDEHLDKQLAAQATGNQAIEPVPAAPVVDVMTCFACGSAADKGEMEWLCLHRSCKRMLERWTQAAPRGGG